jgi:DNA invertase Pin-like site-specific DNA recombinase
MGGGETEAPAAPRVVGYTRVSAEECKITGASLDAQREAIQSECRRRGWPLTDLLQDVGYSGRDLKRPSMAEALRRLDAKEVDCVMVARLDRLSRSLLDFSRLTERARKRGWKIVTLDLTVDTTTPEGELMASILAIFAQYERRLMSQRQAETRAQLRAQARVYGTVPFGFRRNGKRLIRHRVEQQALEQARRLYEQGFNHTQIANALTAQGVRGKRAGRLDGVQIRRLLRLNQIIGVPLDQIPPEPPPHDPFVAPLPYGWTRERGQLVKDLAEQAVITRMRRMYRSGRSLYEIAARLNHDQIPTKQGGRWWASTVRLIMRDEGPIRLRARGNRAGRPVLAHAVRRAQVSPTPYGWMVRRSRLIESPKEQAVIAQMRDMKSKGISARLIAAQLNHEGVPTRKGQPWQPDTIYAALKNKGVTHRLQQLAAVND